MPTRSALDLRLLGGLSPGEFLARHWQKKPLLIRGAFEDKPALPDRDALFALAARDDVESRLITSFDGDGAMTHGPMAHWTMAHGPLERMPRQKRDWTLLVQGVNLFDARADALMRRFDFVSTIRLDDLMISYAVDGGSVGPHFDSYDVFLLQVEGARRWRWSSQRDLTLVDGAPLKLLKHFAPTDEAVLEPGDMLYLPPNCAHEGTAMGSCMTASIGFRAPSWNELAQEFLFAMAEREWPDGRYADGGRKATAAPAAIDREFVDAVGAQLSRIDWSRNDVEQFIGRYFSEPKAHVFFESPRPLSQRQFIARARARGLALDIRTTMLYRGRTGFICGESFVIPRSVRRAFAQLANRRTLDAAIVADAFRDEANDDANDDACNDAAIALLHAWWSNGWIHISSGRGSNDQPR